MGEFKAGVWIIGILVYFFMMILLVTTIRGAAAEFDLSNVDGGLDTSDFLSKQGFLTSDGKCDGKSHANFVWSLSGRKFISCKKLILETEESCNGIAGCEWTNGTNLFNFTITPARCKNVVNTTAYGITSNESRDICASTSLQNEMLCNVFACTWLNQSEMTEQALNDAGTTDFLLQFWDTIKGITTFRLDLGLGQFNSVIIFIFFFIPLLMMMYAIYMSLPFLH